jgi:hypothetical protein
MIGQYRLTPRMRPAPVIQALRKTLLALTRVRQKPKPNG